LERASRGKAIDQEDVLAAEDGGGGEEVESSTGKSELQDTRKAWRVVKKKGGEKERYPAEGGNEKPTVKKSHGRVSMREMVRAWARM